MKRIGIVTWFKGQNYGQLLQAYALQTVVRDLGYTSELVNYSRHTGEGTISAKLLSMMKRLLNRTITFSMIFKSLENQLYQLYIKRCFDRYRIFKTFEDKYLRVGQAVTNLSQCNTLYDGFICGSDQIWAPYAFDGYYFLSFEAEPERKTAYAPSFGFSSLPENITKQATTFISNIRNVSIREEAGAKLIEGMTGVRPEVVLDPTLLLEAEQWKKVQTKIDIRKPYILCYFLGDNPTHRSIVRKIIRQTGLQAVLLPFVPRDIFQRGFDIKPDVGPSEFLYLLENAELICTDSYHGILLSINFRKPFLVFKRFSDKDPNSQNSRIYHILDKYELKDRLITDYHPDCLNRHIDFDKVHLLLKIERERSMAFLERSLKGVEYRQLS